MRVLMLSKALVTGAYQTKAVEMACFSDVELYVVVPPYWREGGSRRDLERAHTQGYCLLVTPMALNGHFHLHFYPRLARHMRQICPDIVHIDEEPYNLATLQAMWLAKRCGAKALFFTWQNLLRAYPFPFRAIERYNYAQADYALAGNREAENVLRAKGYHGPVEVIPQFGVDPEIYRPLERSEPVEGFVIGYIGRLVQEKGVGTLLQAVGRLEGIWRLEIIGDGPQRTALEGLAKALGLTERVAFHAYVPSAEVPTRLNRLDVLVLPSVTQPNWKEQFGRVLIEAMACEVPVIGSDSGEIPHVIGDAGLIFPEGNAEALTNALRQVMAESDRRGRWGRAGRERVLAHYTQARIAERTVEIYRKLCEGQIVQGP